MDALFPSGYVPRLASSYILSQTNQGPGLSSSVTSYDYKNPNNPNAPYAGFMGYQCWIFHSEEHCSVGVNPPPAYFTKVTNSNKETDYAFITGYIPKLSSGPMWNTGLVSKKLIYQINHGQKDPTPIQTEISTWQPRKIGPINEQPELNSRAITRDGITYTTTYGYDDKGLVNYIVEQSPQGKRIESLSNLETEYKDKAGISHWLYTPQEEQWKNSAGKSVNQIARDFSGNGELISENKNGVKMLSLIHISETTRPRLMA